MSEPFTEHNLFELSQNKIQRQANELNEISWTPQTAKGNIQKVCQDKMIYSYQSIYLKCLYFFPHEYFALI